MGLPVSDVLAVSVSAADPSYKMTETYKSSKFYDNFTAVKLTKDQRKDVVAIALSQLGYHEGNSEADFGGNSQDGVRDFVEYNVMSGKYDNGQGNGVSYGYYWCASFVNWCMRQAGVAEQASAGAEISCQRWLSACVDAGIYKSRNSDIPESGDMIFFCDEWASVTTTHVGLVLFVRDGEVHTVEGNTSFTNDYSSDGEYVAIKSYPLNSSYIVGYASPKYNAESSSFRVDHSGGVKTMGQYMPHGRVKLYRDAQLTLPAGELDPFTMFDVTEIGDTWLGVSAKVNGANLSGYIETDADVVQVTSRQELFITEYHDEQGRDMFYPQYRLKDQNKKIYSNAPKRENCGFVGWKYSSADGDVILQAGEELPTLNTDVTLSAVFDSNFYIVSFQNADKTLISQSFGYYGTSFAVPEPKAPDGYVFVGWDKEIGDRITGNAVYTAQFITQAEYDSMTATENGTDTDAASTGSGCGAAISALSCTLSALIAAGAMLLSKRK